MKNYFLSLSGFSIVWLAVLFFFGVFALAVPDPVSAQLELSPEIDNVLDYIEIPSHIDKDPLTNKDILVGDKVQIFRVSDTLVTDDPNELVDKRTSNTKFYADNKVKIYGGMPFYYNKETGQWIETEYQTLDKEIFDATIIHFNSDYVAYNIWDYLIQTVYAQTYSGAGDGSVGGNTPISWATIHDATSATADYTSAFVSCHSVNDSGGSGWWNYRCFLPFDTSALSDVQCIDSASVFIKCNSFCTEENELTLIEGTQAGTNQLVGDDYNNYNTTEFTDTPVTILNDSSYFEIALNAEGLDFISTSSWTKLVLITPEDLSDTEPTQGVFERSTIHMSEQDGTSEDPYLEVSMIDCEESPEATTTPLSFGTSTNEYANDLTFITGWTEHYETSTATPDWIEYHYYHIPFIFWVIIATVALWFGSRFFLELIIRWRN